MPNTVLGTGAACLSQSLQSGWGDSELIKMSELYSMYLGDKSSGEIKAEKRDKEC